MTKLCFPIGILMTLILLVSSCKSENEATSIQENRIQLPNPAAIDAVIDKFVTDGGYPFLHVRLENEDGSPIYDHTAINENLLPNFSINKDSWIRVWSMSKIITIATALDMVEDRLMNLSDPVTKYIPEFAELKVAVSKDGQNLSELTGDEVALSCDYQLVPMDSVMTLLHLLNHQAGFYYSVTGYSCIDSISAAQNLPISKTSQEYIEKQVRLPLLQQPGSKDFYGTNTTILGFVMERASGKSLKQLVEQRLTGPLKINGLQYGLADLNLLPPRFSGKDTIIREALEGELDIFGPSFLRYDSASKLYLGGEGMVATADGYADFVRMLVRHGELNGHRFLEKETVEEIYAPHSQLDNNYGYNGYNLWVAGDSMRINGHCDAGVWLGGGYEGTHFWADPKRKFVGVIMSQMFMVPEAGAKRDDKIRAAIYEQLWADEKG